MLHFSHFPSTVSEMDFLFFDEAEKVSSPIPRCSLLQIFSKFFRFVELCFVLVFLSWSLSRLPIAAEYVGKLFGFIASPLFGFLLCNAIIVALVAKPSKFSVRSTAETSTDRIYEDLIEKSGTGGLPESDSSISEEEDAEIVYQDKQIIVEAISSVEVKSADPDPDPEPEPESGLGDRKVMLRTLSEKLTKRECVRTESEKLRRSETAEKCRNLEHSYDILYYQDDLSSEEFQRKIEAFIAKEKKFRREESSAIVLHCDG